MNKMVSVIFASFFLILPFSAAEYQMKISAPDVDNVVTAFIETVSDELAKNTIETQLGTGELSMDVGRVGSNFNVNYTRELQDMVMQKGDEAKVDMTLSLFNQRAKSSVSGLSGTPGPPRLPDLPSSAKKSGSW